VAGCGIFTIRTVRRTVRLQSLSIAFSWAAVLMFPKINLHALSAPTPATGISGFSILKRYFFLLFGFLTSFFWPCCDFAMSYHLFPV